MGAVRTGSRRAHRVLDRVTDMTDQLPLERAIHHLAFDRNLLEIDPGRAVHLADRLLRVERRADARTGLQGFHGDRIAVPRRPQDPPDPHRLEPNFERFEKGSA